MLARGKARGDQRRFQGKSHPAGTLKTKNKESKKSIVYWYYYIKSAEQASKFEAVTKFLWKNIQQNFEFGDNIATVIVN
jgi:hypothetical protein